MIICWRIFQVFPKWTTRYTHEFTLSSSYCSQRHLLQVPTRNPRWKCHLPWGGIHTIVDIGRHYSKALSDSTSNIQVKIKYLLSSNLAISISISPETPPSSILIGKKASIENCLLLSRNHLKLLLRTDIDIEKWKKIISLLEIKLANIVDCFW